MTQTGRLRTWADWGKGTWARAGRALRRIYYRRFERPHWDMERIEHAALCLLYREAADELGLECSEVGRVLRVSGNGKMFHVWQCTTELDNFPMYAVVEDKALINDLFRKKGFAVPEGRTFQWQEREAGVRYALGLGRQCVIKPAIEMGGGNGVTTRLTRRHEIARAFDFAGIFSTHVLIEEFMPGECYRFLVYKGRCLSVLRRELPTVRGDGASTVLELAEAENRNRSVIESWRSGDPLSFPFPTNVEAARHLKRQGFSWESIPREGERVQLAGASNLAYGCTYTEVLRKTHPRLIEVAEEASELLGMTISGVDIMTADIGSTEYSLIEINIAPGLEIHSMISNPAEGEEPIRAILADYFGVGAGGAL